MRHPIAICLLLCLAGCRPDDYPADWPAPDRSASSSNGGCPDLTGTYSDEQARLVALWMTNQQHGANGEVYEAFKSQPHGSGVDQTISLALSDDGSRLTLDARPSAAGIAAFRAHALDTNAYTSGRSRPVELRIDEDFECGGGWLRLKRFPDPRFDVEKIGHGWVSIRIGKDESGALIAGAVWRQPARGVIQELQEAVLRRRTQPDRYRETTRWSRWPLRTQADQTAVGAAQSVTWHRLAAGQHSTHAWLQSFYLEPVCYQLEARMSGSGRWYRRDSSGPPTHCPSGWSEFHFGNHASLQMQDREQARLRWFPVSEGESSIRTQAIAGVHELPLFPGDRKLGRQ